MWRSVTISNNIWIIWKRKSPLPSNRLNRFFNWIIQSGTPLKYHDLSGLDKFVLKPENGKIIQRLQIPEEDLYKVILRRKPITQKEFLSKFNEELSQFNQIFCIPKKTLKRLIWNIHIYG